MSTFTFAFVHLDGGDYAELSADGPSGCAHLDLELEAVDSNRATLGHAILTMDRGGDDIANLELCWTGESVAWGLEDGNVWFGLTGDNTDGGPCNWTRFIIPAERHGAEVAAFLDAVAKRKWPDWGAPPATRE